MKNHFHVDFAVRNLKKGLRNLQKGYLKPFYTKALKMEVFANGGVLAGLKLHHFQGFTVVTY